MARDNRAGGNKDMWEHREAFRSFIMLLKKFVKQQNGLYRGPVFIKKLLLVEWHVRSPLTQRQIRRAKNMYTIKRGLLGAEKRQR